MRPIDADAVEQKLQEIETIMLIIDSETGGDNYAGEIQMPMSTIRRILRQTPTIEPKRGEWRIICGGKACECTACNEEYDRTFEYVNEWHFCPNCGAQMKGADDE